MGAMKEGGETYDGLAVRSQLILPMALPVLLLAELILLVMFYLRAAVLFVCLCVSKDSMCNLTGRTESGNQKTTIC
jgi:hypothetical protein